VLWISLDVDLPFNMSQCTLQYRKIKNWYSLSRRNSSWMSDAIGLLIRVGSVIMPGSNNHTGQPGTAVVAGILSFQVQVNTDRAAVKARPDDDAPLVCTIYLDICVDQRGIG
jgi:uncharacterized Fe-S radical SAM superfamily protein PflX